MNFESGFAYIKVVILLFIVAQKTGQEFGPLAPVWAIFV